MRAPRRETLVTAALVAALLALGFLLLRPRAPSRPDRLPNAGQTVPTPGQVLPRAERTPDSLFVRRLTPPIAGLDVTRVRDTFLDGRGTGRTHEALDIPAPRGTPVLAVDDGVVKKLFTSVPGGLTVYEFDPTETYCYYYAHLDRYAEGLHEGDALKRGDLVGYVGSTGNASPDAPHLHLAVSVLGADKRWWAGRPIDPYPLLAAAGAAPATR